MSGDAEIYTRFEPVAVEKTNVAGRVIKVRNADNSPRDSKEWTTLWTIKGSKASDLLPKLAGAYETFDECKSAVRSAMSL